MVSWLEFSSIAIDCGMLGNPLNGDIITNGTILGSLASYSCRAGYELEGDAVRVCQPNRSWSNNEPTCLGMLHIIRGRDITPSTSNYALHVFQFDYLLDINECQGDHGCDQECVNDIGGFHCECRIGYQLLNTFSCAGQLTALIALQSIAHIATFNMCCHGNSGTLKFSEPGHLCCLQTSSCSLLHFIITHMYA